MRLSLLIAAVTVAGGVFRAAGAGDELARATECRPRGGLPSFIARLKTGGEVNVAYLGGLFVEFAVNDSGASPEQIYRCMEGIVRKTWKAMISLLRQ